jgi:glycine/D-amino acid oxidase-like deaminating enzyme
MITPRKKLRTSGPLWLHMRAPRVRYRALTRRLDADVLVVGGGITGAMIADALVEAGLDTIVVDRREPTKGSTVASTALVQYEIDTPMIELAQKIGKPDAIRAWRRARLAVSSLAPFFRERGVEAVRRDALYLAGNRLGPGALRREHAMRQVAGFETDYLDRTALRARFGIGRGAAILGFDNLAINPRGAASRLLERARQRGARLFAPVDVVDLASKRSGVVATTRDGGAIRTKSVVLASGYEFPKIVPMRGHRITTTWAFATKPQPRKLWPEECLVWEAATPYLYARTTADGRVLCGGEDEARPEAPEQGALMERKIARLRAKLGKLFPELDTEPEYAWAASFGETATGLPTIGKIPRHRNCWVALGYGGNGITYSRIAAEVLRSALTGERDPDADLYAFPR